MTVGKFGPSHKQSAAVLMCQLRFYDVTIYTGRGGMSSVSVFLDLVGVFGRKICDVVRLFLCFGAKLKLY